MHLGRILEFLQWQSCGYRVAIEWLPSGYRVATEWHGCIPATTLHASRASATKSQEQGIVLWAFHYTRTLVVVSSRRSAWGLMMAAVKKHHHRRLRVSEPT